MTPLEALAQAVHEARGGDPTQRPTRGYDVDIGALSDFGLAATILAALEIEGWALMRVADTSHDCREHEGTTCADD